MATTSFSPSSSSYWALLPLGVSFWLLRGATVQAPCCLATISAWRILILLSAVTSLLPPLVNSLIILAELIAPRNAVLRKDTILSTYCTPSTRFPIWKKASVFASSQSTSISSDLLRCVFTSLSIASLFAALPTRFTSPSTSFMFQFPNCTGTSFLSLN